MKTCPQCGVLLELSSFRDKTLSSGYGIKCNACKKTKKKKRKKQSPKQTISKHPLHKDNDKFEVGEHYEIEYTNLSNQKSTRKIRVDYKYESGHSIRAYCYSKEFSLTFRADRAKILKKIN